MAINDLMLSEPLALPSPGWAAGIPSNGLVAMWDAGLALSHPGSGTTWKNLVKAPADGSGQTAYDLTTSGLTFPGTAGRRSSAEYLASAGAGYCALSANTTFINSMHKAGAAFTWLFFGNFVTSATFMGLVGTSVNYMSSPGMNFFLNSNAYGGGSAGAIYFGYGNAAGEVFNHTLPTGTFSSGKHMIALSFNAAGQSIIYIDGVAYAKTATTATGASASNAGVVAGVLAYTAAGAGPALAGTQLSIAGTYNRALTKTELDAAYNAIRGRFGI